MKKQLKDTYVYQVLGLDGTVANAAKINNDLASYALPSDQLDAIINEIKYKISFPAKIRLIEELKAGAIVLINTPEATAIPAWLKGDGHGGVKAAVVNLFGKVKDKDGMIQFNSREVFALAQTGMVIKDFYLKESRITSNVSLTKMTVAIYERMMYRVLDVLYSLDVGPMWLRNRVRYELRVFCALYMLEKDVGDSIMTHILQDIAQANKTTVASITASATQHYDEHGPKSSPQYESLPGLMKYLSEMNPVLKDLDITAFLRKFIMMYGEKALLMIESYSYFLALSMSVTVTGNIVKDFALEPVIGKDGVNEYNVFFGITR
jgi:hypothetical protein